MWGGETEYVGRLKLPKGPDPTIQKLNGSPQSGHDFE